MKKIGVYIHIPFCKTKCNYCSFNSYADKSHLQLEYVSCLCKEIELYSPNFSAYKVDTIYIGGGTPSNLPKCAISTILNQLKSCFSVENNAEISIEINPNSCDFDRIIEYKSAGINRFSIGLQTTKKSCLRILGRTHTVSDYYKCIEDLKLNGFNNINTDLMIGLPTQKLSDVKRALNLVVKLGVKHISVYSLIVEENTKLYDLIQQKLKIPKDEKTLSMYNFTQKFLRENGYNQYEVSNFACSGYECKHNLNCWSMCEYIGFGAGAHSYYNNKRYSNFCSIEEYNKLLKSVVLPVENSELISEKEKIEETIMLGLRKTKGISLLAFEKQFNINLLFRKKKEIEKFCKLGFLEITNNYLKVTPSGFKILNKIILELCYEI